MGAPDSASAPPLYVLRSSFGPRNVSFPWHAAFSPDGRWVGVSDGYNGKLAVYDAATGQQAWPTEGAGAPASHRVTFSNDSRRMASVQGQALVVLSLRDGAWTLARRIALPFSPTTSAVSSPARVQFAPDGASIVVVDDGTAYRADLGSGAVTRIPGAEKGVWDACFLAEGGFAVMRRDSFETEIRRAGRAPERRPGLLVTESCDGRLWLVASDPARFQTGFRRPGEDARLALQILRMPAGTTIARLELEGAGVADSSANHRLLIQAAFSPDATLLVTVEGTGDIVIRDARTALPRQTIRQYATTRYPMGVAFAPDGRHLLTGGRRAVQDHEGPGDGETLLWERVPAVPSADPDAR